MRGEETFGSKQIPRWIHFSEPLSELRFISEHRQSLTELTRQFDMNEHQNASRVRSLLFIEAANNYTIN